MKPSPTAKYGKDHPNWKGGRRKSTCGYWLVHVPDHPNADCRGYKMEHVLVVERAIGKYLRKDAPVHHVNEDRTNNDNINLVACNDNAYHRLLHMRMTALAKCGNANWRKCNYCKAYDDPKNLHIGKGSARHPGCYLIYMRNWSSRRSRKSSR